jgi:putative membrane protein
VSEAAGAVGEGPAWERLHPASVLVNLLPRTWSLLRNMWPLLLALWFGGRSGAGEVLGNLSILLVFFASALGWTALHALTLRYRVSEGKLEIKSGLLNRQARVISADRVQNVERVQNVFHRMSGLVEVRIETASGTEVEGMLSAIDVSAADRLIASLHPERSRVQAPGQSADAEPPREVLVRNTLVDLAWAGASDLRLGAVGVAMAVFIEFFPQLGGEEIGWLAHIPGLAWGALAVALVSGGWLVGIGSSVLRSYGFELSLVDRRLVAVQGLLTRRRTELGLSKVQLLSFVEPLLLRQVGLGSLQIETAAAPTGGSGTERGEVTVPILEKARVGALCRVALPLGELDPATVTLNPPHPFARTRAMSRAAVRTVAIAWVEVANQGWLVTDALVIARRGVITRTTWLLSRKKLQSAVVAQGPVLAWRGVGLLSLRVAGSRVDLPLLDHAQARQLQRELLAGVPEGQEPAP